MPHLTTFDNFASKAIVHPQFQEGSKAIVHPQFQPEAGRAIVHPQFQPEAGRAIVHPQFQPEADGVMKLGDIKGEFASNISVTYREDGANRFTGKRLNWDAICDVGTSIKQESVADSLINPDHELGLDVGPVNQGADVWTSGSATSIQRDALTKGGQKGEGLVSDYWSPTPACDIGETCTPTCDLGFADDALVQQLNATVPYELQAGMGISPDAKGNTTGTIAAYNVMGSGVPVENYCTGYCFDGGSSVQENAFAPANMQLRSDNRF